MKVGLVGRNNEHTEIVSVNDQPSFELKEECVSFSPPEPQDLFHLGINVRILDLDPRPCRCQHRVDVAPPHGEEPNKYLLCSDYADPWDYILFTNFDSEPAHNYTLRYARLSPGREERIWMNVTGEAKARPSSPRSTASCADRVVSDGFWRCQLLSLLTFFFLLIAKLDFAPKGLAGPGDRRQTQLVTVCVLA